MDVVKLTEPFATDREQVVHKEALQTFGERVTIRRVWTINDHLNGLVERCTQCQAGTGSASLQSRYADLYKQAGESYCSNCYGVGFDGGYRPEIYLTWVLITDQLEDWQRGKTGAFTPAKPSAQFMWTPHLQEFDILARFDHWDGEYPLRENDRFILREVQPITLRTGPRPASPSRPLSGTVGVTDSLIVAQQAQIENLPQKNPMLRVPMVFTRRDPFTTGFEDRAFGGVDSLPTAFAAAFDEEFA